MAKEKNGVDECTLHVYVRTILDMLGVQVEVPRLGGTECPWKLTV